MRHFQAICKALLWRRLIFSFLGMYFLFPAPKQAAVMYTPGSSFRSMAMGNTGVASAHDNEALFYNPASLADIQRNYFDLLSAQLTLPPSQTNFSTGRSDYNDSKKPSGEDPNSVASQVGTANKWGARLQSSFAYQFIDRGWSVGGAILAEANAYSAVQNQSKYQAVLSAYSDIIRIAGFSVPFGFGSFVIGASGKTVERTRDMFSAGMNSKNQVEVQTFSEKGNSSPAADVGALIRVPGRMRFRMGVAVINAGGLKFKNQLLNEDQEVVVGFGIAPTVDKWRTMIALDFRDLTKKKGQTIDKIEDPSFKKRTHFGMELGYYVERKTFALFNVRAGLNQGLPTWGAEFNFLFGRTLVIGVTSFQEDISNPNQSPLIVKSMIYYLSLGI